MTIITKAEFSQLETKVNAELEKSKQDPEYMGDDELFNTIVQINDGLGIEMDENEYLGWCWDEILIENLRLLKTKFK